MEIETENKLIPAWSHTFFRTSRGLPDSTLGSYWLMLMLTFVLIDRHEYFGFRVSWFFDGQFKTSISKINCISYVLSF